MRFSRELITLLVLFLTLAACAEDPNIAIATAVAGTTESQIIQTGVAATQEAANAPVVCLDLGEEYFDAKFDILDQWFDAIEIADSTPRMSLAGPVGELQAIRREMQSLQGPDCTASVDKAVIRMMDHSIEGFLLFMRDEPESSISAEFNQASKALQSYNDAMAVLVNQAAVATREASVTPTPSD